MSGASDNAIWTGRAPSGQQSWSGEDTLRQCSNAFSPCGSCQETTMPSKLTQHIAHLFDLSDVRLFVVQDADGILAAEEPSAALMERGITRVLFESSLDLRYLYESRYRGHLAETRLAVVTRIGFCTVPLEILSRARRIELSLASLFPHLDAATLRSLSYTVQSRLYDAPAGQELMD